MRTVSGVGRWVQARMPGRSGRPGVRQARGVPVGLFGGPGEQRVDGALLDQVDGTTCGSAVLVALAACADPAEADRLRTGDGGFAACYDARQLQVHRQTNRFWPRALGTTPWGMVAWLRRHAPAAGRYRIRLVDDRDPADLTAALTAADAALAAGTPVPLLLGSLVPRHWVLALRRDGGAGGGAAGVTDGRWRVYEPSRGRVQVVGLAAVRAGRLGPVLGAARLHALLLPGWA